MIALVASVLGASLLGSPHCAGMCGGFVCFVAGQDARRWLPQALYHVGRLVTYLAIGALAGGLGSGIDRIARTAGLSRAAAVGAGLVLIAWGGVSLATALGARLPWLQSGAVGRNAHVPIAAVLRRLAGQPAALRVFVLGLLTTLLPCGWLWAFVATAASTGSAAGGLTVMATFWLGTLPALTGLALIARGALGPLRRRMPAVTAVALVLIGLLTVTGKLRVGAAAPTLPGTPVAHGCH